MVRLLFLFIFSISGTLIIKNQNQTKPQYEITSYSESNFCSAPPPTSAGAPLINVDNTQLCGTITQNITGAIVYTLYNTSSCPLSVRAQNIQNAGGIGLIHTSTQRLTNSTITTVFNIFCIGVIWSPLATAMKTDNITAIVTQPNLPSVERDILLTFLDQTHETDQSKLWNRNLDPCSATNPVPPSRAIWKGVTCTVHGTISSLILPFSVNGNLPDDLCNLTSLTTLTIQDDVSLTGDLPLCPSLRALTISGSLISVLPTEIFKLNLASLDLSNNKLTGPLPDGPDAWNPSFTILYLQGNALTGTIPPSLLEIYNLGFLNLGRNQFEGDVPDFTNLPYLYSIDISDNLLTNFSEPANATHVLISCLFFKASFNQFTSFPLYIAQTLPVLDTLLLDHNKLTAVPDLSQNPQLAHLDVSYNEISGVLHFSALLTLVASNNNFSAVDKLSGCNSLSKLDLSNNRLTGTLSDVLPNSCGALSSLSLNYNQLTSVATLQLFPKLATFEASHNLIVGDLSFSLPGLLYTIDLSFNNLTGNIPNTFLDTLVIVRLHGNPTLAHGSSALLPAQVLFSFDFTTTAKELGFECPTYTLKDIPQSTVLIDPSYHEYKLCRCLPGYYHQQNVTSSCQACLPNAICPGKENPLTLDYNANIIPEFGYFPLPDPITPTVMIPCRFGVVLASDPNNPCNPLAEDYHSEALRVGDSVTPASSPLTRFSCAIGYHDRLCSRCVPGYFRKEGRCLRCNNRPEYPLFLIAIVIIFLSACLFFAVRQPVDTSTTSINPDGWTFEPKQRLYDFVPLILHFFQTSTIILVKLESLDVVQTMNSLLVTASFSTPQSGIGFECGLPVFQEFVTQYLAVVIFPPILAVVLVFFFVGKILYNVRHGIENNWKMLGYQYTYGLFSMFDAIHFPLVTYVLGVFQCTKDPVSGILYFTDHPYLLCDSISPAGKVFPLLLYPIGLVGFFVGLGVYLHYAPSDVKESEPVLQSFAFFFVRFKPDRVASGVFFISINLGLSLVVGLLEPDNDVFPTLIVLILQMDFFFVTVFQPYLQPRYNKVRSVNCIVALLLFVNNLIYAADAQFPVRTPAPAVIYVGLNVGMIIFYAYHIYRIIKLHRNDVRLIRAASTTPGAASPHRHGPNEGRSKHVELTDIKQRKHTNIDPPSTSQEHAYAPVPVTATSPVGGDSVELSAHSPLPIISENDTDLSNSKANASPALVFTENPLAETSGTSFVDPPSPSSKD